MTPASDRPPFFELTITISILVAPATIEETLQQRTLRTIGDNLTDKERATLTALGRATAAFRDLSTASMPTSCVAAFCQIATGEAGTVSEHARSLHMGCDGDVEDRPGHGRG